MRLASETEDALHFERPDGSMFRVAKKAVTPAALEAFRARFGAEVQALARGGSVRPANMAGGGVVPALTGDPAVDAMLSASPSPTAPPPVPSLTGDPAADAAIASANAGAAPSAAPMGVPGPWYASIGAAGSGAAGGYAGAYPSLPVDRGPVSHPEAAAPVVPAEQPGGAYGAQPAAWSPPEFSGAASVQAPAMGGILGQLQAAQKLDERGIRGQAVVAGQVADAQARALEEGLALQKQHQETTKQRLSDLEKEHNAIAQDVQNTHIDPRRLWSSKSSGEKALAVIGIALGGLGSALTGQANPALQILQRQIEQDIDAQKSELGKKENLLSQNLAKTQNMFQAEAMTRVQLSAALEGQLKLAAARSGSADAIAKADQLIAQSRERLIGPMMQIAQYQAGWQMMQQSGSQQGYLPSRAAPPTGTDPTSPLKFVMEARKDASERTLIGPGGKPFLAYDKETAGKTRPMLQAVQNVKGILSEMTKLRQNASGLPGSDAADLYHKYRSALAEQWALANGLTQPSEAMNKNLETVMPSNWDAYARGAVRFEPIMRLLHERESGLLESAGLHPQALPIFQLPVK
jgi:hypothetical protein